MNAPIRDQDALLSRLQAEVERLLGGRTRDIKLSETMLALYQEKSWPQRSKIARSWMIWVTIINLFSIPFYYLMLPNDLGLTLLIGLVLFPTVNGCAYLVWRRPRCAWVEGLSVVLVMALTMTVFGAMGLAGDHMVSERYPVGALFVTTIAVVIFEVKFVWSLATAFASWMIFVACMVLNPANHPAEVAVVALFFAMGLMAVVNARRTASLLAHKTFLMSLRNDYHTAALTRANRQLETLATRDPLTGLANRRSASTSLANIWADAATPKSGIAFIMADIDYFKSLNDAAGHAAGDDCIARVARAIETAVRMQDIVCRHGGEEFLVVLTDVTPGAAWYFAERIRTGVESQAIVNPGLARAGYVTISLGVAFAADDVAPELVIKRADEALYDAKRAGRNRVLLVNPANPDAMTTDSRTQRTASSPAMAKVL